MLPDILEQKVTFEGYALITMSRQGYPICENERPGYRFEIRNCKQTDGPVVTFFSESILRETRDGKTEVEYRITLSGEQVERSKNMNNGTSQQDANYLHNVVQTLEASELVDNSSSSSNQSITGQCKFVLF